MVAGVGQASFRVGEADRRGGLLQPREITSGQDHLDVASCQFGEHELSLVSTRAINGDLHVISSR